jgi:hypothetical protein
MYLSAFYVGKWEPHESEAMAAHCKKSMLMRLTVCMRWRWLNLKIATETETNSQSS